VHSGILAMKTKMVVVRWQVSFFSAILKLLVFTSGIVTILSCLFDYLLHLTNSLLHLDYLTIFTCLMFFG
jgi:hypothetical protein